MDAIDGVVATHFSAPPPEARLVLSLVALTDKRSKLAILRTIVCLKWSKLWNGVFHVMQLSKGIVRTTILDGWRLSERLRNDVEPRK